MDQIDFLRLIFSILISESAGAIGFLFSASSSQSWYSSLEKPLLNPPSWVFGPVWTILFALIGVALFLVRSSYKSEKTTSIRNKIRFSLFVFSAQFVLNIAWSILFFGLKNPGLALIDLIILYLAIVWLFVVFYKISKPAAWLLIPYLLWVGFAGYLNYSIWRLNPSNTKTVPEIVYCTEDAKLCPDGSFVGRTGPRCEFKPCPEDKTVSWKVFTDNSKGFSFKYPEKLETKYISAIDWPPKLELLTQPFDCAEAGSETARAGKTELKVINGRSFCITSFTGGAAGSLYIQYAYAFPKDGKTAILTFSIREVQCGNYEDPQKSECLVERDYFDINPILNLIVNSLRFK